MVELTVEITWFNPWTASENSDLGKKTEEENELLTLYLYNNRVRVPVLLSLWLLVGHTPDDVRIACE